MDDGTAPETLQRLRELTGPELYQRNAFRLTGLTSTASRRAVRQRRQHVTTAARAGVAVPGGELPVPGRRGAEGYGTAFDVIDRPQRRIADELFWLWGDADPACGCDPALHRLHDDAVRAHARVLDAELGDPSAAEDTEADWHAAADGWRRTLDQPTFWDHLHRRVAALDDRRLDASVVGLLEREVRRVLVAPLAELAVRGEAFRRLAVLHAAWSFVGERILDEVVEQRVQPELDAVHTALDRADALHTEHPERAVPILRDEVVPRLTRLRAFDTGAVGHRVLRLTDHAALLLNNCAVGTGGGSPLPAAERSRLLELASALVTRDESRHIVHSNQQQLLAESTVQDMEQVRTLLEEKQSERALALLRSRVLPNLDTLRASEDDAVRRGVDQLTDGAAVLLNNCAVALSPPGSPAPDRRSSELLDEAARLARTRGTRKLVRKNRRRLTRGTGFGLHAAALDQAVSGLTEAESLLRRQRPSQAAEVIEQRVVPQLDVLRTCRGWRSRRTAAKVADQTAVLLNNCAVALVPDLAAPKGESIRLLDVALDAARSSKTRRLVRENQLRFRRADVLDPYAPVFRPPQIGSGNTDGLFGVDEDRVLATLSPVQRDYVRSLPPQQRAALLNRLGRMR